MKIARLFAVLVLLAALAGGWLIWSLHRPYGAFGSETFVDIPRGTSTGAIAGMLERAGVISAAWQFQLARLFQRGRVLQAGEYRFSRPASILDVYGRIARGDIFYYELLVPEGKNMFDIAAAAERLGIFSAAEFLAAARNPAGIRDLDRSAPTLEGYLFPSTYRVTRDTTPERLCRMMTAKFRDAWHSLGAKGPVHDTVTLASLVEKEGKLPDERPLIAAVFRNRLAIGMKLDCDPTTIYAAQLEGRYRGTIYRSDLDSQHPYNTYRHAGLPPGPIANPGLASLRAAQQPADTEALYFVLRPDGSGGHTFSGTIAAQQAAVAKYRRGLPK